MGLPPVNRRWGSLFIEEVGDSEDIVAYTESVYTSYDDRTNAPPPVDTFHGEVNNTTWSCSSANSWLGEIPGPV